MDELENILAIPREEVLLASAKEGTGSWRSWRRSSPASRPEGNPRAPLRGLVFDSHYDQYKGVVTYVRLAEGTIHEHARIRLMGSGAEAEILSWASSARSSSRSGSFPPVRSATSLQAQERPGRAGRRHGHRCRNAGVRAPARLPARQEPRLRGDLPDLGRGLPAASRRDGEASPQRCELHVRGGELDCPGLRLPLRVPGPAPHGDRPGAPEREFSLELIASAPSVEYRVTPIGGGPFLAVDNPALMPSAGEIEVIEEPWVKLSVITPSTYIGPLMELSTNRRGTFTSIGVPRSHARSCSPSRCRSRS